MKLIKFSSFIYVIILHVLFAVVLVNSNFIQKLKSSANSLHSDITPHYRQMLKYHKRMDASLPIGTTLLIGDSIVQALATARIALPSVNYGIGQDTTLGVLQRIPAYQSIVDAKLIVLAVGINDLFKRDVSETIRNYNAILSALPACKQVLISAVLPVDTRVISKKLNNSAIDLLNTKLESMAGNRPNTQYLNTAGKLKDEIGGLADHYHIGDGLHLNENGYEILIADLNKALIPHAFKTDSGC